ncbi:MAG: hypothetical protein OET90_09360, partial [Desulfuromonadales bacterium]|nr:hypothetical protein [Desulfuromonadales bacterium]
MSLQEKLDAMKAASQERIPAEVKAIMKQSLEQLAASGRKEQALKVGDQVPEFCLQEGFGNSY